MLQLKRCIHLEYILVRICDGVSIYFHAFILQLRLATIDVFKFQKQTQVVELVMDPARRVGFEDYLLLALGDSIHQSLPRVCMRVSLTHRPMRAL